MATHQTLLELPAPREMLALGFIRRGTLLKSQLDQFTKSQPTGVVFFICPFFKVFNDTKIEIWSKQSNDY